MICNWCHWFIRKHSFELNLWKLMNHQSRNIDCTIGCCVIIVSDVGCVTVIGPDIRWLMVLPLIHHIQHHHQHIHCTLTFQNSIVFCFQWTKGNRLNLYRRCKPCNDEKSTSYIYSTIAVIFIWLRCDNLYKCIFFFLNNPFREITW
jgi:hypothetical protein